MAAVAEERTFTILYFAAASSFTKKPAEKLQAPLVAAKLFETLESKYPGITAKVLDSCAVTINMDYIDINEESGGGETLFIQVGDEVAIIPPVSSG